MKKTIITLILCLCGLIASGEDFEVFNIEPQHDAFMGTTVEQVGIQYYGTDFSLVLFFYNQRTSKAGKFVSLGLVLSGEWEYENFYLKFDDEKVHELTIVSQEYVYTQRVATNSAMLIEDEVNEKLLQTEGPIQARMVYKSPLFTERYDFDFTIPEQFIEEARKIDRE